VPRKTPTTAIEERRPKRLSAIKRVSRKKGRSGEKFMSPRQQEDAIKRWARAHDVEIVSWHDETDSVSGRTTDREGLKAAMAEVFAGESDGIIVAKVDRFARSVTEGLAAVRDLRDAGKAFVAVNDGIHGGADQDTPTGKLMLTLLFALAEWLLDSLTQGWENTRERHIRNGTAAQIPYGCLRNGDRRLEPDPETAPVVRRIFTRRAEGTSWTALADELSDGTEDHKPVVTPTRLAYDRWVAAGKPEPEDGRRPPRPGGERWVANALVKMVANRTYLGELRSGDYVNPAAHEALVSVEVFEAANNMAKSAAKRDRLPYLLAGLVRCASCGGLMAGHTQWYTPAKHGVREEYAVQRYRCRDRYSWGRCPKPATIGADQLNDLVLDRFRADILDRPKVRSRRSTGDLTEAVRAQHEAEAELRSFLTSDATARMTAALGEAWRDEGIDARTAAVVEARERVTAAQATQLGVAMPTGIAEDWETMGTEERRTVLSLAYGVVAVAPGRSLGPVDDRVRIWGRNEPGAPVDLPGRGSAAGMSPIVF
jgi:DNA invertase Pin-like site-specific DNA recombinase